MVTIVLVGMTQKYKIAEAVFDGRLERSLLSQAEILLRKLKELLFVKFGSISKCLDFTSVYFDNA